MQFNQAWFPNNSNFNNNDKQNEPNVNIRHSFPPPVLPGMVANGNFQVQRFSEPFIRAPLPFLNRPPFPPQTNERNPFRQNGPQCFEPRNQPFVPGPRMPSAPIHQPYPVMNQTAQAHPQILHGGPPQRHFNRWNQNPYNGSFNNQVTLPTNPSFTDRSCDSQEPVQAYREFKSEKPAFEQHLQNRAHKSWMTDEIYQEVKKKNALYGRAKCSGQQQIWREYCMQRKKVQTLIKGAKVFSGNSAHKIKQENYFTKELFLCDTCDRVFTDEAKLNKHFKEHIKCGQDGCQFEAHPKVIHLHRKMQHETGYAKTILKLTNPEEIEKWREERRRRFPTAKNIQKRREENAEKKSRGEVIETKDFGKFKKRAIDGDNALEQVHQKGQRNNRFTRNRQQRGRSRHNKNKTAKRTHVETDSDDDSHIKLPRFEGMLSVSEKHDESPEMEKNCSGHNANNDENNIIEEVIPPCLTISDEDEQDENVVEITNEQASEVVIQCDEMLQNGHEDLSVECLQMRSEAKNGIADDSDDDAPSVIPIVKSLENDRFSNSSSCNNHAEKKKLDVAQMCPPRKQFKERNSDHVQNQNTLRDQKTLNAIRNNGHHHSSNTNSLLEKLLAKEISHERNIVFQCMRHVVENKFFGVYSD